MMINDESSFFDEIKASIDFCSEVDKHLVGVDLAPQKVIIAMGAALSIEQTADYIAKEWARNNFPFYVTGLMT